jgi:hypothetical protein
MRRSLPTLESLKFLVSATRRAQSPTCDSSHGVSAERLVLLHRGAAGCLTSRSRSNSAVWVDVGVTRFSRRRIDVFGNSSIEFVIFRI